MFSLESPHRGDCNEYTQHTIIDIKTKITQNYHKYNNVCSYGFFYWGLKNEFEIAVVNEPSVFEPLKIYSSKLKEYMKISEYQISWSLFDLSPRSVIFQRFQIFLFQSHWASWNQISYGASRGLGELKFVESVLVIRPPWASC